MPRTTIGLSILGALALVACAQIPDPGVRLGAGAVRRTGYCEPAAVGPIEHLEWRTSRTMPEGGLWIGGRNGVIELAPDGEVRRQVRFEAVVAGPVPIDLDGDGVLETMNIGGGWSAVGLLDADGRASWSFPPRSGLAAADMMAAGPVLDQGALGFVVGMNAGDGVRVLDVEGVEVQRWRASNVFSVAIADFDEDGRVEIVHTDAGPGPTKLQVREPGGMPIRRLRVDLADFRVLRWPGPDGSPCLFGVSRDVARVVDIWGDTLLEVALPDEGFGGGEAVWVRLAPVGGRHLALVRTIKATWQRAALYVFDEQRRLVYHEVFDAPHLGLAALPAGPDGAESLLVGAGSRVWRYDLVPAGR